MMTLYMTEQDLFESFITKIVGGGVIGTFLVTLGRYFWNSGKQYDMFLREMDNTREILKRVEKKIDMQDKKLESYHNESHKLDNRVTKLETRFNESL